MGHSTKNKAGTKYKIGGKGDVTSEVYTEKTLEDMCRDAYNYTKGVKK